jgi:uncharacterized protein YbaP (TraB family)
LHTFRAVAVFAAAATLLAGCASAPEPPREQAYSASLLWQVEGAGSAPSYVLGTFHSSDPRLRNLLPEVRRALDSSEIAAFELLRNAEDDARLMQAVQQPEGSQLEDVLGPELFQRTAAAVAKFGVPPEGAQRLTPLGLLPLLAYPRHELTRITFGEPVFDDWLQREARRQGKALHGLETYDEQIALFGDMSAAEQVVLVSDLLNDHARVDVEFGRMVAIYLAGDLEAIMAEAADWSGTADVEAAERFRRRLLDDRNRIMVARMIPLMQDGATFVAVGAAHLGGEMGILALLAERGFTLTRLD